MKIEDTGLPRKLRNILQRLGIDTVYDLCELAVADLLRHQGVGRRSLAQIEKLLAGMGKELKRPLHEDLLLRTSPEFRRAEAEHLRESLRALRFEKKPRSRD